NRDAIVRPSAVIGEAMVSRRTLPAMQSSHSFCARLYRRTERTNPVGQARLDLRPTRLWPQGRLFEGKNISVPENALIQFNPLCRGEVSQFSTIWQLSPVSRDSREISATFSRWWLPSAKLDDYFRGRYDCNR